MRCPKCKKNIEFVIGKETGLYCPKCKIPIELYKQVNIMKKIRKCWGFNPRTRVVDKDKKKKSRVQIKREFKKEINND